MKKIGIISVPQIKLTIGRRIMRPIVITEEFERDNKYIVAEISYSVEEIMHFGEKKLRNVVGRAKRLLESQGADGVLFAQSLRNVLQNNSVYDCFAPKRINKIPPCRVVECFLKALQIYDVCKEKVADRVVVCDREMRGVDFDELLKICMKSRDVVLYTWCIEKAERVAQKLFEEYGVLITVKKHILTDSIARPQIMVDIDKGRVRIKDFVVDGAEFISGSGKYALDPQEEAQCLGDECRLSIRNLMSGKIVL